MKYNTILTVGGVTISMAEPSAFKLAGMYSVCTTNGVNVKITNANNYNVRVDIWIYEDGNDRTVPFAYTSSTMAANNDAFLDFTRPFANKVRLTPPNFTAVMDIDVIKIDGEALTTSLVNVNVYDNDFSFMLTSNPLPSRFRFFDGASVHLGIFNRKSTTMSVVVNNAGGVSTSSTINSLSKWTSCVSPTSVNSVIIDSKNIPVQLLNCGVIQLNWYSRRDGIQKDYAFNVVEDSAADGDNIDVERNGEYAQLRQYTRIIKLKLPSATYGDWYYVSDLNSANVITMLTRRMSMLQIVGYDYTQDVKIATEIKEFNIYAKEDLTFEIQVRKESVLW